MCVCARAYVCVCTMCVLTEMKIKERESVCVCTRAYVCVCTMCVLTEMNRKDKDRELEAVREEKRKLESGACKMESRFKVCVCV